VSARRELLTNSIAPRIKAVLTAAEQTAALVAQEAESEASRRTSEVIAGAYADAERIRREATRRVEEYLAASRRRVDAFATERIERITELTEGVIEASSSIQDRFEQAAAIQREVHTMVEALGTVAEAVAREAAQASPELPEPPPPFAPREGAPGWAQTGPDGSVIGEVPPGSHDGLDEQDAIEQSEAAANAASPQEHDDPEQLDRGDDGEEEADLDDDEMAPV
jgi:hypothetical protein